MRTLLLLCVLALFSLSASALDWPPGQPAVYVFTEDYCPACISAEQYFAKHQIRYLKFNIEHDPQALQTFQQLGARGTPFILIGGKRMTGFSPELFEQIMASVKAGQ